MDGSVTPALISRCEPVSTHLYSVCCCFLCVFAHPPRPLLVGSVQIPDRVKNTSIYHLNYFQLMNKEPVLVTRRINARAHDVVVYRQALFFT